MVNTSRTQAKSTTCNNTCRNRCKNDRGRQKGCKHKSVGPQDKPTITIKIFIGHLSTGLAEDWSATIHNLQQPASFPSERKAWDFDGTYERPDRRALGRSNRSASSKRLTNSVGSGAQVLRTFDLHLLRRLSERGFKSRGRDPRATLQAGHTPFSPA